MKISPTEIVEKTIDRVSMIAKSLKGTVTYYAILFVIVFGLCVAIIRYL